MQYYRYLCDPDRYHGLATNTVANSRTWLQFTGKPLARRWKSPLMKWQIAEEPGDFPDLAGHIPAFGGRAKAALAELLEPHVEFLPLKQKDPQFGPHWAVHVLPILDCLDEKRSEVERAEDGTILFIDKYVFVEKAIAGRPIFRIKGYEFTSCYVSREFRDIVQRQKLKGLIFKPLP